MIKTKKLFTLSLFSLANILPIALAISCGSQKPDLVIGIRPEDQQLWDSVAQQFEKATGKKVGFKWVSSQSNDYSLWSASNLMPDIGIVDSSWAKIGIEREWFQPLDLNEIVTNQDLIITGQDEKYKENPDLKIDESFFETAMLDTMKTSEAGYNGLAVIYGPKITYAWQKLPKKDDTLFNIYDGSQDLEWYVPDGQGNVDQVVWGSGTETKDNSPLFSSDPDHHRLKNTIDDVQEFLTNAVRVDDLKFNQPAASYTTEVFNQEPSKRVIASGTIGYMQRLASISKTLYDFVARHQNELKSFNLKAGSGVDVSMPWDVMAYGDKLIQTSQEDINQASWNLDANNVLNDNLVFSNGKDPAKVKWDFASTNVTKNDLGHYHTLGYLDTFGYDNNHIFANPKYIGDADDMNISFAGQKMLFLGGGALWMWDGIKDKINEQIPSQDINELITSFGQPIQLAGVDGYAIAKNVIGEKLTLAKQFIRFMMQEQVAADITGNKAKSTVKSAQALQVPIEGARAHGLDHAGVPVEMNNAIKNVPFTLAKSSTASNKLNGFDDDPVFDAYLDFWMVGNEFNYNNTTLASFAKSINVYNQKYIDSFVAA